jgi:hypothetical protein
MSWIAITEAHVKSAGLTGPELSAARTTALPDGVTDTLADVISRVTAEVRGRVAACDQNVLGEGATIPDECLTAALARIVFELGIRLPGRVVLTEQRDKANDNALRFLRDVAACDVAIVQPETPTDDVVPGGNSAQLLRSSEDAHPFRNLGAS